MHECLTYEALEPVPLFNHLAHQYNLTRARAELVLLMFSSFDTDTEKIFQQNVHQYLVQFCRIKIKLGKVFTISGQQPFQCLFPAPKITPFKFDLTAPISSLFLDP